MVARYGGAFATSMALHAAIAVLLAWSSSDLFSSVPSTSARSVEVTLLPPSEDTTFPGLKPVAPHPGHYTRDDFGEDQNLPGADLQRIADHAAVLFPFVTPGLALDAFFPSAGAPSRLVFRNPLLRHSTTPKPRSDRRLRLTDAAIQKLVDQTWTRANRFRAFRHISTIITSFDADDERVAALVRRYCEQNGLEPYADGPSHDLRFWAQLGLAADHVDFIKFIRQYVETHPSTRVTTEVLFLLDTVAEANEDALAVFVETSQPADLEWTRQRYARAYQLAKDLQREYGKELTARGLRSREAIGWFYDNVRLQILAGILQTTPDGYRSNDARFLMGSIQWKQGRRDDALRVWRRLGPSGDDSYATAIARIREAVATPHPSIRDVGYILRNQEARWLSVSEERLKRFGYRVDMY